MSRILQFKYVLFGIHCHYKMSCKGTLTVKQVVPKNCFVGVLPGLYTSLTGKDYKIPILMCGTIQLQVLRSTNIADLVAVIPIKIYSTKGTTIVEPENVLSKSTVYSVKTSFDATTNTLTIQPSNNWNTGTNPIQPKKPWLTIGIFITLATLMVVVLVLLSISMTEMTSVKHSEKKLISR